MSNRILRLNLKACYFHAITLEEAIQRAEAAAKETLDRAMRNGGISHIPTLKP